MYNVIYLIYSYFCVCVCVFFMFFRCHWPLEVIVPNTIFRLVYWYILALFGNDQLIDPVYGIFVDQCNTYYLLHVRENVYFVRVLLTIPSSRPSEKYINKIKIRKMANTIILPRLHLFRCLESKSHRHGRAD